MKYNFIENKSIGNKLEEVFVGGRMLSVPIPKWKSTEQGDSLRSYRRSLGIGLRKAASILEMTGTGLTGLEIGKYSLSDDIYSEVLRRLQEYVFSEEFLNS